MKDYLTQKYIDYKIKRLKKDSKLYEISLLKKDGLVLANQSKLQHIQLCVGTLPKYYVDKPFKCKDCGSKEIWKAVKQKHYFEEMKGKHLDAVAIRCKHCRNVEKQRIKMQKQHMRQMSEVKPHPNELFFKHLDKFKKSNL